VLWLAGGFVQSIMSDAATAASSCRYMQREAQIVHVAREKVRGAAHHAKAGNINSALLKEGPGCGEFILVLDCDMIVHPNFLMRTLGHFYWQPDDRSGFAVLKATAAAASAAAIELMMLHHQQRGLLRGASGC
jgi:cellulose synthase/poly-beta-1,6-N-acetylglucosamine synthase-like glycosyltransferase